MLLYSIALVVGALLIVAAAAWVVRAAVRSSDEGPPAWPWVVAAAAALLAIPVVVVCAFFFLTRLGLALCGRRPGGQRWHSAIRRHRRDIVLACTTARVARRLFDY